MEVGGRLDYIICAITEHSVTYSWCEVTVVTRRIVDSWEMTSSEDVHFIVVTTQLLTTALLPVCCTIYS